MPSGWGLDMNRNRLAITAAVIGAIAYPAWTGSSWHEYCYSFIGVLIDALFGAAAAIGPLPQHHNGIFVSSDEGKTFSEINGVEPSTFGFPVVVHPREPDTAWFVPEIKDEKRIPPDGKLIVTRTRDGGKSFDVLTKGLPQSHAYDVVYRHALALDEAGNRLEVERVVV